MIKIPNFKTLDHRKRIGLIIQSGILGWIIILSHSGVISIDPSWHENLVLITGAQLILLSSTILTFDNKNTKTGIICQVCNMTMHASSYKCRTCNSKFTIGGGN